MNALISHSLLFSALMAALPVFALEAGKEPTPQTEVIVTAARRTETVDNTLATVNVITRAEIERSQAPDLLELLRLQAGIDLARTGAAGQSTALFLRGSNSNHTLVLIDGVRVSSTFSGAFDFAHLPVAQIERIEIVRGPRAAYWGSEAIGGVIQIFTRQPEHWFARIGMGSHNTTTANGSAAWRGKKGILSLTLGENRSDGISAQNENGFAFDPDRDSYQNRHINLRAETGFSEQTLTFSALKTDAEVDFDQGQSQVEDTTIGLNLSGDLNEYWFQRLAVGSSKNELNTAVYFSRFTSKRETLDWHNRFILDDASEFNLGINYAHERGQDLSTFDATATINDQRHNRAVYAGYQRNYQHHDIEVALRRDDNSIFGGNNSMQAGWGWQFSESARFLINYGEGFRAPNLNEQFSPGFGGLYAGNPQLQPEQSKTLEFGLRWQLNPQQTLDAHLFRSHIRDLISFSGSQDFRAENIARADIDGLELEHALRQDSLLLKTSITLQHAQNTDTRSDLLRRPRRKLASTLDYDFNNGLTLGGEVFISSARQDFADVLPGYGLLNLRAGFAFSDNWRIEARIDNVLDRRYELARGFNTPDRSFLLALVAAD